MSGRKRMRPAKFPNLMSKNCRNGKTRSTCSFFICKVQQCPNNKNDAVDQLNLNLFVKISVYAHDSCACTALLCMHNTLVHALGQGTQGRGTKPGARDQAWDPKRARVQGLGPAQRPFSVPGLVPVHAQECCACTRVLCMHKNLEHAQES